MDIQPEFTDKPKLQSTIQVLLEHLPPRDFDQPVRGEVEFYGAARIIAEAMGFDKPPRSWASWSHGFNQTETLAVFIAHEQRKDQVNLVRCERHTEILREAGFPHAISVGMPYLYALKHSRATLPRIPGSLLIMPAHTITNLKAKPDEEAYLKEFAKLRHHFSLVVACLHGDCIKNGFWCERLEAAGIPWIIGASNQDTNALRRMHALFSSFEFMTSNGAGSHLPYAAATGCKTSLFGELFSLSQREAMLQNPFYRAHPEALEYNLKKNTPEQLHKRYDHFFTEPQDATDQMIWGLNAIGEPSERKPEEIARLLGWSWCDDDPAFGGMDFTEIAPVLGHDQNRGKNQRGENAGQLEARLAQIENKLATTKAAAKKISRRARKAEQKLERSELAYQQIRKSVSWKLTRPFHSIEKRIRKLR